MKLTLHTNALLLVNQKDENGGNIELGSKNPTTVETDDPEAIMGFGEEVLSQGHVADLALYLEREAVQNSGLTPAVTSALVRVEEFNTERKLAVLTEEDDKGTYFRFFLSGQGRPLAAHQQNERRIVMFDGHSAKMMQLLNEEAEKQGYDQMVLSDRVSAFCDTNARLLLCGTLGGYVDGIRSYGSLTARCSIFQTTLFTLASMSVRGLMNLQFTQEEAVILANLAGLKSENIEEQQFGWVVTGLNREALTK